MAKKFYIFIVFPVTVMHRLRQSLILNLAKTSGKKSVEFKLIATSRNLHRIMPFWTLDGSFTNYLDLKTPAGIGFLLPPAKKLE